MDGTTLEKFKKEGYVEVNGYLIKPSNPTSSMVIHSLAALEDVYGELYHYYDNVVNNSIDSILLNTTANMNSKTSRVKLKKQIFLILLKTHWNQMVKKLFTMIVNIKPLI
jgi:hypothetical protein